MTVCIAAICEGGTAIVVAADRMFTAGNPVNVEFETTEQKIETLSPACVALLAGNSAYGTDVVQRSRVRLGGSQQPPILSVADIVKDAYVTIRNEQVREQIILPFLGPDFVRVESLGQTIPQYLQPQPNIYGQIVMQWNQYNLGADLLIVGLDQQTARLAVVTHPGTLLWLDKLGFAAIGSGGQHAQTKLSLARQDRNVSLLDTVYRVYEAKKAAESAPGVGVHTDLAVIKAGTTKWCSDILQTQLKNTFDAARGAVPQNLDAVKAALDQL